MNYSSASRNYPNRGGWKLKDVIQNTRERSDRDAHRNHCRSHHRLHHACGRAHFEQPLAYKFKQYGGVNCITLL